MFNPNELIEKSLKRSTILGSMSLLLVKGTLPLLVAPFGISSPHEGRLLVVWLVSNLGEELVN